MPMYIGSRSLCACSNESIGTSINLPQKRKASLAAGGCGLVSSSGSILLSATIGCRGIGRFQPVFLVKAVQVAGVGRR